MIISYIILKNWKNFRSVEVELKDRVFLVGANASGKSNFLDALRFLRDIAKDGGGLQKALNLPMSTQNIAKARFVKPGDS